MKTLPEVLHFWKSLVSSVRNCNTSTHHTAWLRIPPPARSPGAARAAPTRRGPGLAHPGVPPGLLPPRPARGRLARPVTGRSPERWAPQPRPCGTRRGPTCSLSSSTIAPLSSTPRSRAGSAALARSRRRAEAHARREAEPRARPTLPSRRGRDRAGPSGTGVSRTGGGTGADRPARPRPAEGSATSAPRYRRHAPARPLRRCDGRGFGCPRLGLLAWRCRSGPCERPALGWGESRGPGRR